LIKQTSKIFPFKQFADHYEIAVNASQCMSRLEKLLPKCYRGKKESSYHPFFFYIFSWGIQIFQNKKTKILMFTFT